MAITGSWLLKVHQHDEDKAVEVPADGSLSEAIESIAAPTIDELKAAVVAGLQKELGGTFTVSLAERTDD